MSMAFSWTKMKPEAILIRDGERTLSLTYEAMAGYHGGEFPAGTALGYRLVRCLAGLVPGLERGGWLFYNGLGKNGPGITDSVDYCLRIRRDGGWWGQEVECLGKEAPPAPGGGRYYFEFWKPGICVTLSLKEGLLPEEFFLASRERHQRKLTAEEEKQLWQLRKNLEETLLSTREEIFLTTVSETGPQEYERRRRLCKEVQA